MELPAYGVVAGAGYVDALGVFNGLFKLYLTTTFRTMTRVAAEGYQNRHIFRRVVFLAKRIDLRLVDVAPIFVLCGVKFAWGVSLCCPGSGVRGSTPKAPGV